MTNSIQKKAIKRTLLAPLLLGTFCSYEIKGNDLVCRFLGILPISRTHLSTVHYLRLATRSDTSLLYFILNFPCFMFVSHRSVRPIYVLQTQKKRRILMKLKGGAHFKLRQAIAQHSEQRMKR